jgi:hypothetical protein
MGWKTMPDTVQETAFDRLIKEGKAYQFSREFEIPAESIVWVYIQISPNADVLLNSRNIAATAGPVRYKVYPQTPLVGPLGNSYVIERLNFKQPKESETQINDVLATSIDISGIAPTDEKLVVATQNAGNRGSGNSAFQNFFKVYPANVSIAVSLSNAATITSYVELQYIWAEDVE